MNRKDNTGETCGSCLNAKGKGAENKHGGVVSVNIEVSCPVRGSTASIPGSSKEPLLILLSFRSWILSRVASKIIDSRDYGFNEIVMLMENEKDCDPKLLLHCLILLRERENLAFYILYNFKKMFVNFLLELNYILWPFRKEKYLTV